jgi:pilus assembly protein Flp/PilA
MTSIRSFLKDESGATMVEYGLMIALIAVVSIAVVASIGETLKNKFEEVNTELAG